MPLQLRKPLLLKQLLLLKQKPKRLLPLLLKLLKTPPQALLMQPQVLNVPLVRQKVSTEPAASGFQSLLKSASWQMGGIMLLSAVINFALATWLLEGKEPQTPEHNSALSKLNWGGMLVIGIPMLGAMMVIMLRFFRQLATLTGLEREDILNPGQTVRRRVG